MATKSLSIRIEEAMLDKLHVIADYEGRSVRISWWWQGARGALEASGHTEGSLSCLYARCGAGSEGNRREAWNGLQSHK